MSERKFSILFVCLGNICRSPMAEAVFTHLVAINLLRDRFLEIGSAGTAAYHVDELPDPRSVLVCSKHGVPVDTVSQEIDPTDFDRYDYIIAMDNSNLRHLKDMQPPNSTAQVKLFGEFGDGDIVKDPYYGPNDGFERNFIQCRDYSIGLLKHLGFNPIHSIN